MMVMRSGREKWNVEEMEPTAGQVEDGQSRSRQCFSLSAYIVLLVWYAVRDYANAGSTACMLLGSYADAAKAIITQY